MKTKTYRIAKDYLSGHLPTAAPAPLAVWDLHGGTPKADLSGNGHDLVLHSGAEAYADLLGDFEGFDNRSGTNWLKAPAIEAFRIAIDRLGAGDASLTLEMVAAVNAANANPMIGSWGSGETEATNYLYSLYPETSARWYMFNERGNGTNISMYFPTHAPRYSSRNGIYLPNYLAMTVDATGALRNLWQNGEKYAEVSDYAARKETSGNTQVTYLGGVPASLIYSVRITAGVYTHAQVNEVWDAIRFDLNVTELGDAQEEAGLEDDTVSFFSMSGPASHLHPPIPRGYTQPGPAGQPYVDAEPVGPVSQAGLEDDAEERTVYDAHVLGVDDWRAPRDAAALTDAGEVYHGDTPQFNWNSLDQHGNLHFSANSNRWYRNAFVYDARSDPWANPGLYPDFTAYGKNGRHFTSGVEDAGPVYAPWAAEGQNADRGPRVDFPDRALIVVSMLEVTIFDLDDFPTNLNLDVWMRFRIPSSTTGDYYLLGRGDYHFREARMLNGVLYVATIYRGTTNGRVFAIDFKRDGEPEGGFLIDPTNRWEMAAGKSTADRHAASNWSAVGGFTTPSNSQHHLDVSADPEDWRVHHVLVSGDDNFAYVRLRENVPEETTEFNSAQQTSYDVLDYVRKVAVGPDAMLWFSSDRDVWTLGLDYREGGFVDPTNPGTYGRNDLARRYPRVRLPAAVQSLAVGRYYVYAATAAGVYIIEKTARRFWLAYTGAGGGGGGKNNSPPAGEILPWEKMDSDNSVSGFTLEVHSAKLSDYLSVCATWNRGAGGVAVIRTFDDAVVHENFFGNPVANPLSERGALFCRAYTV